MTCRRGDIVIADFPYSDRIGSKIRPALVISTDSNNNVLDDMILAAVSRSTRAAAFTHVFIDPTTTAGKAAGLLHPSFIQCENLFTIDQRFILRSIGSLTPTLVQQINQCLKLAQDLP